MGKSIKGVLEYVQMLENDRTVTLSYMKLTGNVEAMTIYKCDHYYIFINNDLNVREQRKVLYHEALHIYSDSKNIKLAREEAAADKFAEICFEKFK